MVSQGSISFSLQEAVSSCQNLLHLAVLGSSRSYGFQASPDSPCLMERSPLLPMVLGWDHSMPFEALNRQSQVSISYFSQEASWYLDREVHGPENQLCTPTGLGKWAFQATEVLPALLPTGTSAPYIYIWKRGPFSVQSCQMNTCY